MKYQLKTIIDESAQQLFADTYTLTLFRNRIAQGGPLLREAGSSEHFCTFFVPVNRKKKQIYLGHHKKANLWIPPGGHIELADKTPVDTIKREWREELGTDLNNSDTITLFNLSIIHITPARQACIRHFDIWYLVDTLQTHFIYDPAEYYDAGWYDLSFAQRAVQKHPPFVRVMRDISSYLNGV